MQGTRTGIPAMSSSSAVPAAAGMSTDLKTWVDGTFNFWTILSVLLILSSELEIVPMELMCLTHGTDDIFF